MSEYRKFMWCDTITLYHRTESKDATSGKVITTWSRATYANCYYGLKVSRRISGLGWIVNNTHLVRIPAASVTSAFALGQGDIIVRGDVSDTIATNGTGKDVRVKYADSSFIVNMAKDNMNLPNTAHWLASEEDTK